MYMLLIAFAAVIVLIAFLPRGKQTAPSCAEWRIEGLESRIAPAALTAKLSAGVLTIAGDPGAPTVDIVQTGSSIEVLDGMTSLGTFDSVKSILVKVEGGADVEANLAGSGISGSFKVLAKGGIDVTLTAGSKVGGALKFTGDTATQTLILEDNVTVGKSLTFLGAAGADNFIIGAGTSIGGSATFGAVEIGIFAPSVAITIGGNLTVKNSATFLDTSIGTSSGALVKVAGSIKYFGGGGADTVSMHATSDEGVTFVDLSGKNGFSLAEGSMIGGSVLFIGGSGDDQFNVQAGQVQGNVTLKLGTGNNRFSYGIAGTVSIGKNFSMITGGGNDVVQTSGGGMNIGGNLSMLLGDGSNQIVAGIVVAGTKVTVKVGSGMDTVSMDGNATNAKLSFSLGGGADVLAGVLLRNSVSAVFDGGAGIDRFFENSLAGDPIVIIGFEDFT